MLIIVQKDIRIVLQNILLDLTKLDDSLSQKSVAQKTGKFFNKKDKLILPKKNDRVKNISKTYCDWICELVIGNVGVSIGVSDAYQVAYSTVSTEFDISSYLNFHEMCCLVRICGTNTVKYIDESLIANLSTHLTWLKQNLIDNSEILASSLSNTKSIDVYKKLKSIF